MASIKERSTAKYQLVAAKIKESKDGKTKYVVADFVRAGLDKLMAAQENGIRLQILPKYGIAEDAANAYLQMWVDEAKRVNTKHLLVHTRLVTTSHSCAKMLMVSILHARKMAKTSKSSSQM